MDYISRLHKYGFDVSNIKSDLKSSDKISIKCINNHIIESTVFNIMQRKKCVKCEKIKPFIEYRKALEREGCIVLTSESEYKGVKHKLSYICKKGHKCFTDIHHLKRGQRCRECKSEKLRVDRRLSLEKVVKTFESEKYKIVEGLKCYKNEDSIMTVECPNIHTYQTTIGNFRRGYRCKECFHDRNRGSNSSSWLGGITSLNNYLRISINTWKRDSLINGNYRCFITGLHGEFHVHHHKNFSDIVKDSLRELQIEIKDEIGMYESEELMMITNKVIEKHYEYGYGVVMLKEIHNLFHKVYGRFDNNMNQVLEFKENYLNGVYMENDLLKTIYHI